ncbi:sugar phosphate isomerase/epimerase and 4-hydroxyphenylpyruvate domain-containing protein [Leekyejoonella antrihumi]|uniref:3-dehydroshikimate dehydratase n=1 Tax=Leekyejoonella antrihumi TaxID=1660198 RepID=A0A563E250_9MICO|nr:sugar phosphate isomerase/epimerase and 4-hydroxyphenylpyruvate domain-containing protein [Leekyejoonella antrihumi]TWP36617.1 sugar phosphate isomerase/epimerase and 4-hydroxyphenylpyruvate domain-containing protein [Leekyejoonella antrihumi]
MRRSIATVSVSGDLEEKLAAISAAKFDGIELYDPDLVASRLRPGEIASRCADLGLTIELFQPLRDLEGLDPDRFQSALGRLEAKLEVMEQLGAATALVCSNTSPGAIGDVDLSAEQLHLAGQRAAEHGIRLGFEALAWGTHVSRVSEAWEVIRRADHHALGLVVDTFHILARGDTAEVLQDVPGDQIAFLQIADAPHLRTDILQWSRHHRCFPGQGTFDLASVVGAVIEKGYRGPLSLEVFSDVIREAEPRATALDGMRSLIHLEEELRSRWAGQPDDQRPHVTLTDPPPAPRQATCGFLEIAVRSDGDMSGFLQGLGFVEGGTHRTKPVSWWRNGGANIVLNASSDLADRWTRSVDRPAVVGLAVAVPTVAEVSERADALLWPRLALRHDLAEAPRDATDTPAGVHLFLVEGDRWQDDFVPTPAQQPSAAVRIIDVDHLGYRIPFEVSDAEISFYRTLLGLPTGAISEFTEPRGWLRSRVVRSEDHPSAGALQIVLNVIETRTATRIPDRGLNQIAFIVADVFAAVRTARTSGIGMLEIPDNYYEDLRARSDLSPALIGRLREHNVLYDRDSEGELLHAYTRHVADAFYVELLERRDGYGGFGSVNTPVRLVAQARQTMDARPPTAQ